jgi:hypothetical protein
MGLPTAEDVEDRTFEIAELEGWRRREEEE